MQTLYRYRVAKVQMMPQIARLFSQKIGLFCVGLFCGKSPVLPVQMRNPMHPCHPVFVFCSPRLGEVLPAPPYGSEPNKRHSLSLQPRREVLSLQPAGMGFQRAGRGFPFSLRHLVSRLTIAEAFVSRV